MTAIDTNVLVRILTHDEPRQTEKALALLDDDLILIPVTVMLETEWVLRYCYRLAPDPIVQAFRSLLNTPGLILDECSAVAKATELHAQGVDFADALHLSLTERRADRFCTFDRALALAQSPGDPASPAVILL